MNLDLFADEPIAVAPPPPPAARPPAERRDGETFVMIPLGEANRWTYLGEIVTYDAHRPVPRTVGRWATVEDIGKPILHNDDRVELCRAIRARLQATTTTTASTT